jgi:hypothetical protein
MRFVDVAAPQGAVAAAALRVVAVRPADEYRLTISFSDGAVRTVDFGPFLLRNARHPAVQEYLDPVRFGNYTIRDGDLMWGDYDLLFPIADLYRGNIF